MKQRIWELDALRGVCILGMVLVHLVYDLVELYGILQWSYPVAFTLVRDWGGVVFLLLSGTCVTLGRHHIRRGLVVLGCGLAVTLVTVFMVLWGFDRSILIYFGVLHCLGVCMLLWGLARRFPTWVLGLVGTVLVALGLWFRTFTVDVSFLFPLGLCQEGFLSSDHFPLLPYFGFFLLGAVMGRTVYREKTTLFPRVNPENGVIRFLSACGRQSLPIYLLHQPILSGICLLLTL